ncbi:MAG: hypothetical protein OXI91_13165 [Chloroflexota bacterium]|nr:hypothetical protein [Chloroflexota bacterium]
MTSVIRAISLAANLGRFLWRHKRLTLALAVGLLVVAPLLTGSGFGTFFLNLIGLGIAALVVRRIVQAGNRRQATKARNTGR